MYTHLPDLLAVQLESFRYFLETGLRNQLDEGLRNLYTPRGQLILDTKKYKLSRPKITPQIAFETGKSYETTIYIPIHFCPFQLPFSITNATFKSNLLSNLEISQKFFFNQKNLEYNQVYYPIQKLPLLTESSYFIVNGVRRVVVNQMVRCPNIYYKVRLLAKNKRTYIVSFISDRGLWIRIERDRYKNIWVRMNDLRIELVIFLRALGITDRIIEKSLENPFMIESINFSRQFVSQKFEKSVIDSRKRGIRQKQDTRKFLYENVFSQAGYSLSKGGRMRMNKKFGFSTSLQTLRPEDFLAGLNAFIQLELGYLQVDDIDHLKNRRVRLLHHLLADQTRRGLKRLREENGIYIKDDKNIRHDLILVSPFEKKDLVSNHPILNLKKNSSFVLSKELQVSKFVRLDDFTQINSTWFSKKKTLIQKDFPNFELKKEIFDGQKDDISGKIVKKTNNIKLKTVLSNFSQTVVFSPRIIVKSKYVTKTIREFFGLSPLSQFMDQINPLASLTQKRRLTCLGPGGVSRQSGVDIRDIHPSHYGRVCPIETPEGKNAGLVNSLASYAHISMDGSIESSYSCFFKQTNFEAKLLLEAEHQTHEVFYPLTVPNPKNKNFIQTVQDSRGTIRHKKDVYLVSLSPTAMISVATSLIPFLEHDDGNRALMASNMQRQAVPILVPERPVVGTGFEAIIARDSRSILFSSFPSEVLYVDGHRIVIKNTPNFCFEKKLVSTFNLEPFSRSNHNTILYQYPAVEEGQILRPGDILADTSTTSKGELSLGKNMLVAYMAWEGYNFEDAVLLNQKLVHNQSFTSIHIEKLQTSTELFDDQQEEFYIPTFASYRYDRYGIIRPGIFVKSGDILVGKKCPRTNSETPEQKLLYAIFHEIQKPTSRDCSFKLDSGMRGRVFETFFFPKRKNLKKGSAQIHLLLKRPIQIGDKIAGRHGNKGIISNILPISDMPYLSDGTTIDIVLNPLGVPSRMNVGQIFECLLGFAGMYLEEYYRIRAFDEIFSKTASQMVVYTKLKAAQFDFSWMNALPFTFGKVRLFDGRTGLLFENPITVGFAYILKLVHLVDDKIHARLHGPYTLMTQQPVKGRSGNGGQRVGEMEVWAFQGFSVPYLLQEMLTLKSDDCYGRVSAAQSILFKKPFPIPFFPESFHVTLTELRGLCFNLTYNSDHPRLKINSKTQTEKTRKRTLLALGSNKNKTRKVLPVLPSLLSKKT